MRLISSHCPPPPHSPDFHAANEMGRAASYGPAWRSSIASHLSGLYTPSGKAMVWRDSDCGGPLWGPRPGRATATVLSSLVWSDSSGNMYFIIYPNNISTAADLGRPKDPWAGKHFLFKESFFSLTAIRTRAQSMFWECITFEMPAEGAGKPTAYRRVWSCC